MTDELLHYYNRELAYVRRLGAEFAQKHPKIAGRLRLGPDVVEDPHVSRMVEAFAFLTARVRHKLDDGFPELTDSLLGVLFPDYQAPIPSMGIVQFTPQADLSGAYVIPQHAELETLHPQAESCRFRTCYPTTLWPIHITSARLLGQPFTAPRTAQTAQCSAVLRIELQCLNQDMRFSALKSGHIRFYLKGQAQHSYRLLELLINDCAALALASGPDDPNAVFLGPEHLRMVGFDENEAVLPYSTRTSPAHRLLAEFFAFADKFLFVDLVDIAPHLASIGNKLQLYIYLRETSTHLEQHVTADNFALGCVPVINLFAQRAEPILLSETVFEHRLVPDVRRPNAMEIHGIQRVTALSPDDERIEFVPFYGAHLLDHTQEALHFWHSRRESAEWSGGRRDEGSEVYLSLVDIDFKTRTPGQNWVLHVDTLCTNRNLPNALPFGGGQPRLQMLDGSPAVSQLQCVTPFTPTRRPVLHERTRWQLAQHLTLNHFTQDNGLAVLKSTLGLYDLVANAETKNMIEGLLALHTARVSRRVRDGGSVSIRQGIQLQVELDESRFTGTGVYLFAALLDRFFAQYCNINAFTELVTPLKGRPKQYRWPPRSGYQELV
jgi:type VI secretion system protein ImpG